MGRRSNLLRADVGEEEALAVPRDLQLVGQRQAKRGHSSVAEIVTHGVGSYLLRLPRMGLRPLHLSKITRVGARASRSNHVHPRKQNEDLVEKVGVVGGKWNVVRHGNEIGIKVLEPTRILLEDGGSSGQQPSHSATEYQGGGRGQVETMERENNARRTAPRAFTLLP